MSRNLSHSSIIELVRGAEHQRLSLPVPTRVDHADHFIALSIMGHTKLAADHLMFPAMRGRIQDVLGSVVRRFSLRMAEGPILDADLAVQRFRAYDSLLELAWNLAGAERRWAGFEEGEAERAINAISHVLAVWEESERKELGSPIIAKAVVAEQLEGMKVVNKGKSMLAWMAGEVEGRLEEDRVLESYVRRMSEALRSNFYYEAYAKGVCKFGNDYALGLRWLRHLGFVQVSTNPVLAARAYEDCPTLWENFKRYAKEVLGSEKREWLKDPDAYADELTMEATRFALMDNFQVFRLPFHLSGYHDGLVSYQLNPLIAGDVEKSLQAARWFALRLEEELKVYDEYLLFGYTDFVEKGRPNLVVKVAAAYPASMEIARRLNEMGIGQNITLSYTVSQEVLIAYMSIKGMVEALKRGILPTQTYDTNMGGRLEDHLREVVAAEFLTRAFEACGAEALVEGLARDFGAVNALGEWKDRPLREVAEVLARKKYLGGTLIREEFVKALFNSGAFGDKGAAIKMLERLEGAIRLSGAFVARRVYDILFSPANREKWIAHLMAEHGVAREEAELALDRIDLLLASKRKPLDTLLTLGSKNVTSTEFPDQQLAVAKLYAEAPFKLNGYLESITHPLDAEALEALMQIEDFVKAYESSEEVNELLRRVGIAPAYGNKGLRTEEWPSYGPCAKTLKEFSDAYLAFREKVVNAVKELPDIEAG